MGGGLQGLGNAINGPLLNLSGSYAVLFIELHTSDLCTFIYICNTSMKKKIHKKELPSFFISHPNIIIASQLAFLQVSLRGTVAIP